MVSCGAETAGRGRQGSQAGQVEEFAIAQTGLAMVEARVAGTGGGCRKIRRAGEEEIRSSDFENVGGWTPWFRGPGGGRRSVFGGRERPAVLRKGATGCNGIFARRRPMRPRKLAALGEAKAISVLD